jgi:predicted nucleic acid-binding protein
LIIIDASAVVEFLLGTPTGATVSKRIADPEEEVAAPYLLDVEVAQAIRLCFLAGLISDIRAAKSLEHLANLSASRWPHEPLLPRIWALRHNFTAYDAAYIALAESLGATLLTCDRALAGDHGINCDVELIV